MKTERELGNLTAKELAFPFFFPYIKKILQGLSDCIKPFFLIYTKRDKVPGVLLFRISHSPISRILSPGKRIGVLVCACVCIYIYIDIDIYMYVVFFPIYKIKGEERGYTSFWILDQSLTISGHYMVFYCIMTLCYATFVFKE